MKIYLLSFIIFTGKVSLGMAIEGSKFLISVLIVFNVMKLK